MKQLIFLFAAIVSLTYSSQASAAPGFDKAAFYAVVKGKDLKEVSNMIDLVRKSTSADKNAYEGMLQMKKAGLVSNPADKLSLFKKGHKKLEAAIKAAPSNIEYHFLRLVIQENAPGILGYKDDIVADGNLLKEHFKKLSPEVQSAIKDYSSTSKTLKPTDF